MAFLSPGIIVAIRTDGPDGRWVWCRVHPNADVERFDAGLIDPRVREGDGIEILSDTNRQVLAIRPSHEHSPSTGSCEDSPSTGSRRMALRWPWRRTGGDTAPALTAPAPVLSAVAQRLLVALVEESGRSPRDANRDGAFAAAWEKIKAVGIRVELASAGDRSRLAMVGWELRAKECVAVGANGATLTEAGMRAAERANAT